MISLYSDSFISSNTLRISKRDFSGFTLFFVLLSSSMLPQAVAVTLAIVLIFVWLWVLQLKINKKMIILLAPLFLLLVTGSIFAYLYNIYNIGKDIWYVGRAMIFLSLGYLVAQYITDFKSLYRIIVMVAVISAIIHLLNFGLHMRSGISVFTLRREEDVRGYFISLIGLVLLLVYFKDIRYISVSRARYYFSVVICSISLFISFSRTFIVLFIILLIVMKGWAKLNSKINVLRAIAIFGLFALIVISGILENDVDNKTLTGKFAHSASEIQIQNYEDKKDINLNWRGFESYRALVDYKEGSVLQKLVGQGLGSTIDLGFYMKLGGTEMRYIPRLHNGYMYLLVKFGIIGLLLYLYFIMTMIKTGASKKVGKSNTDALVARKLLTAVGWCFLFSTIVISGVFNTGMLPLIMLVGVLSAWRDQQWFFRND